MKLPSYVIASLIVFGILVLVTAIEWMTTNRWFSKNVPGMVESVEVIPTLHSQYVEPQPSFFSSLLAPLIKPETTNKGGLAKPNDGWYFDKQCDACTGKRIYRLEDQLDTKNEDMISNL